MIVLDTNVISELMNPNCDPAVRRWIDGVDRSTIFSTTVTSYEISFGIARLPEGKRTQSIVASWRATVDEFFGDRFHPLDHAAGTRAGEFRQLALAAGNNCDICDVFIAAIASCHNAEVATRNLAHINGLPVKMINPWMIG